MLQMLAMTAPLLLNQTAKSRAESQRKWTVTGERITQLDDLDHAMQHVMQAAAIRAGSLAVTCMGKTLFARAYTWAEKDYPITQPDSLFRLASVEKAFIVALTYEMVQAGAISLDTRAFPYLDMYHLTRNDRAIDRRLNDITVKQLIENRSGLPRWFGDPRQMSRDLRLRRPPTTREALGWVMTEPLLFAPGTQESYSTLGHDVLALICTKAAGMDYFDALRKYVKGPHWDVETFPYTKEYTSEFKGPAREVRYDDPGRGLSYIHPDRNEMLPYAYGGGVIFLEGAPGVLATAAAVARLVGNYAARGYGPRNVSDRNGAQSGTFSWTWSRGDRLDVCYIFNTRYFGQAEGEVYGLSHEIGRALDRAHVGCEVLVYAAQNFNGVAFRTHDDERRLPERYNDRVSSIKIVSGQWELYENDNFNGRALKLGPGEYARLVDGWDGIISSLRCVAPTLGSQVTPSSTTRDGQQSQAISANVDAGRCTQLSFRQTADMCNNCTAPPWNGELTRISGDEWRLTFADGRNRSRSAGWWLVSTDNSEMIFVDGNRSLFTRFDLMARKGFQRRSNSGAWSPIADVLTTQCR
jgi:CubicO group peptidase (beta-lactamase class C family)